MSSTLCLVYSAPPAIGSLWGVGWQQLTLVTSSLECDSTNGSDLDKCRKGKHQLHANG